MLLKQGARFTLIAGLAVFTHAEIVPDGSTVTGVSLDSRGREVVDIAPADSDRISHNRYTRFNVSSDGAILNNRTAGARTIINEVTGQLPSSINGELRVQGTRAHVILANPNGISVNGAEVFNMASLALATGKVGYQQRTDEFGATYQNPVVTIDGGNIAIGEAGLSGSLNRLELLSRSLTAVGDINNNDESAFAALRLRTGAGSHEFSSGQSVADPSGNWITSTMNAMAESTTAIAIDISSSANFYSSRVELMVTDLGAGVKAAGNLYASANDFTLQANGRVELSGDIKSASALSIKAGDIYSRADSGKQNTIESQYSSVFLDSESSIHLESTLISAKSASEAGQAALQLNADDDIRLLSRNAEERSILFSLQDLELNSENLYSHSSRMVANAGLNITASLFENKVLIDSFDSQGLIVSSDGDGKRLWYTAFLQRERERQREIRFGEPEAGRVTSEILAGKGDINITVREYRGLGADIIANDGGINVVSDIFTNEAAIVGTAWMSSRCNLGGCDERGGSDVELLGGNIQASTTLNITANQQLFNHGGVLQAVGDVSLTSPDSRTEGIEVYDVLTRNKGLRGLLLKNDALWVAVDQGGAVISNMGRLNIDGSELQVVGGRIESALNVNGGYAIVREPTTQELLLRKRIGLGVDVF